MDLQISKRCISVVFKDSPECGNVAFKLINKSVTANTPVVTQPEKSCVVITVTIVLL